MGFDSLYLDLLNAYILKLINILLNDRNGIKFQYPSIVFSGYITSVDLLLFFFVVEKYVGPKMNT